jgi:hypothetical protein
MANDSKEKMFDLNDFFNRFGASPFTTVSVSERTVPVRRKQIGLTLIAFFQLPLSTQTFAARLIREGWGVGAHAVATDDIFMANVTPPKEKDLSENALVLKEIVFSHGACNGCTISDGSSTVAYSK